MKYLILSDIHGSNAYLEKVLELCPVEELDKIIILGDVYYHGPRNPLPDGYAPMEVAKLLNSIKDKLVVLRGNCDAEVDQMISEFVFVDKLETTIGGKTIFFSHGHHYNIDNLPSKEFDIMFYGHFHTGFIREKEGKLFVNPGSISLPKDNTPRSFVIFNKNSIILEDLDGNTISQVNLG